MTTRLLVQHNFPQTNNRLYQKFQPTLLMNMHLKSRLNLQMGLVASEEKIYNINFEHKNNFSIDICTFFWLW